MDPPKKNHFYKLRSSGEKDSSLDMVTCMLEVFSIDTYALVDPGNKLSSISFFMGKKFNNFPDFLNEPLMVTTPVVELVIAKRVYRNFPIMFPNRLIHVI